MNFVLFILFLLSPIYNYAQDYAEEIHNMKGHPIKVTLTFKPPLHHDGPWNYVYLFNDSGKVKQQSNFLKNKLAAEYHYQYDKNNRVVTETHYDRINHVDTARITTFSYLLDKNNRVITEFMNGNVVRWIKDSISYDQSGLPLAYQTQWPCSYKDSICITRIYTFKYDDNKKLVYSKQVSDDSITELNYEYNNKGSVSLTRVLSEGEMNTEDNFTKKPKKLKLKADRLTKYEYKYDKHGNWIKRYTSIDNSKFQLDIVRKIKY